MTRPAMLAIAAILSSVALVACSGEGDGAQGGGRPSRDDLATGMLGASDSFLDAELQGPWPR